MGWLLLAGGALLDLYSRTTSVYDSALGAMGGTALRLLTRVGGTLAILLGTGLLLAECTQI